MQVAKIFCLGLGLCVPPWGARADDPVQDVTVTATRLPTAVQKIPAGVTVITRKDFQRRGDTTLVQALSAVPGLGVVQSGGAGDQASVFIRGSNSEDVLVLLDGVPVNDPSDANGAFNFGDYTLNDIQRIEVVRGPMSGLYGANAIGGVINLITVQGSGAPKAELELAGGWPAQGQGGFSVAGSSGAFDYALGGAIDEEAGFDDTAERLSVYGGHRDPFRSKLGAVNFGYSPLAGTRVYLVARAQRTDAAFPDLGYPIFDDPDAFDYNTDFFGKFGVSSDLFDGLLSTELFVACLQNELQYKNLLDATDPNAAQADDVYRGYRTDVQWNNTLHLRDTGFANAASVLFGVEYSNDSSHENVNENDDGFPFTETVHAAQHSWAGHVSGQATLWQRLTMTAALRDDAVSSFGNAFTGRVGGVLAVPAADMNLKASYGTSFLAPSLFELYGVDNYGYVGNPDLRPEYSSGFEAGPQFDIPAFGNQDFASISAMYFQSKLRDLIMVTPDFTSEENIGRAKINGVETEFVFTAAPWAQADITYTYTRAVDALTGARLLRRPQNAGAVTLSVTPTPQLSITPQLQYIGRFSDYLYDNNGYPLGAGPARPGTIVNLSAAYKISGEFTLFAAGKNIFGAKFEPVNGLQIPGASLLLGVRATIQ